jgi:hypothetical protein
MIATVPSTVARPPERGRTKDHPQIRIAVHRNARPVSAWRVRCYGASATCGPGSCFRGGSAGAGALSGTCRPSLRHTSKKQPTPSVTNKKQRGSLIWQPTLYMMPMKGITVLGHKGMVAYLAGPRVRPKEPAGLMKGPHDEACRAATSDEVIRSSSC